MCVFRLSPKPTAALFQIATHTILQDSRTHLEESANRSHSHTTSASRTDRAYTSREHGQFCSRGLLVMNLRSQEARVNAFLLRHSAAWLSIPKQTLPFSKPLTLVNWRLMHKYHEHHLGSLESVRHCCIWNWNFDFSHLDGQYIFEMHVLLFYLLM